MILFRGYVATKNKKCLQKFANGEKLLTLEQAQQFDEYAGILNIETVLIDVDDLAQSEILMNIVEAKQLNCRVYQTTRGRHFLFKNKGVVKCATGAHLACGLQADVKIGSKNSYSILKFKGEERFIEWDSETPEQYDELPAFLSPIQTDVDFLNMQEGDGRNQQLFNYIITLQKQGLKKDDVRECLTIINDYVLKQKLKPSELKTIMRDEAFIDVSKDPSNFFNSKGQFLFDKFSNYLMETHKIIKINKQLHIYHP